MGDWCAWMRGNLYALDAFPGEPKRRRTWTTAVGAAVGAGVGANEGEGLGAAVGAATTTGAGACTGP